LIFVGKVAEGGWVGKYMSKKAGADERGGFNRQPAFYQNSLAPLVPFLKGRWVGIDNKTEVSIHNNLTPLISLSL